jgi:hypothetical protein
MPMENARKQSREVLHERRQKVIRLLRAGVGIKLPIRAVGNDLARWGFTLQKLIKNADEQRPEAVKPWLNEPYPSIGIEALAKAQGGEIHWVDETAGVNTDVRGCGGQYLRGVGARDPAK